jgi:hypothetical protein
VPHLANMQNRVPSAKSSLFALARCWLDFHNFEVTARSRRPSISARHCRLISNECYKLSDIGIKVNTHTITIDIVRDSPLIHESVVVRLAGGQATGNFAPMFWRLTESECWRNHQDRQHQ